MNAVRILQVSDTHLGIDAWYRGSPPGWRRSDDHFAALRTALEPAFRQEVEAVVHTGDLFDRSRPPPRVVAQVAALWEDLARRVPVVLLPGNHDRHGLASHFPQAIPGVQVLDAPSRLELRGADVGIVPFFRSSEDWSRAAAPLKGVQVLWCHQSFHGCRVPGFTFRAGEYSDTVGESGIPRVGAIACGHIHPRQRFVLGEVEVVMPGATERTSFGEGHQPKGYAIWELGATVSVRFADLPSRRMLRVERETELEAIKAGDLVHLPREGPEEWEEAAIARGGWVVPRKRPSRQMGLFG